MTALFFLPGAGASALFWRPVADLLDCGAEQHFFSWPGLGNEPHAPEINGIDDLVSSVLDRLHSPADLVAQSMGGLVAIKVALAAPRNVRRLVLCATSGGIPIADLGGAEWRAEYRRNFPNAASWITDGHEDLSSSIKAVDVPVLLLWGSADAISPPAVGRRLERLLPNAELHIIPGGDHDMAQTHAATMAPLIADHLQRTFMPD